MSLADTLTGALAKFAFLMVASVSVPAKAEDLYTVWSLVPTGEIGAIEMAEGEPFLVQQLLPLVAVRLSEPALVKRRRQVDEGTILFKVFQADGVSAYCTLKDQSDGNVSKSAFIPVLDRRYCLVDHDKDGNFDGRFSVFDKYGSALTPTGKISKAKDLLEPAAYEEVAPSEFPLFRGFAFYLDAPRDNNSRHIRIMYDNGRGYVEWENHSVGSTADTPLALNVRVSDIDASEQDIHMTVDVDRDAYLIGTNDGRFIVSSLPPFANGAN